MMGFVNLVMMGFVNLVWMNDIKSQHLLGDALSSVAPVEEYMHVLGIGICRGGPSDHMWAGPNQQGHTLHMQSPSPCEVQAFNFRNPLLSFSFISV